MTDPTFRDAQEAFKEAIESGRLSESPRADNFVGDFMYMGTYDGVDSFKNKLTRQYLPDVR